MDPSVDTVSFGESKPAWKREADAGRDHRCSPSVDGLDDLVGVDALQVDRSDAEVAVAELALDDVERDAVVREFDGVRVAELVRGKAPAYAGAGGESAQHRASWCGLPRAPARGAVDDAEQGSDGHRAADGQPGFELFQAPVVHPDLAAASAFAAAHEDRSAAAFKIEFVEIERLLDAQSGAPEDDDQRASA